MTYRWKHIAMAACMTAMLSACSDEKPNAGGPIILGDSASIVTETDQQQLKDLVTDLTPVIPPSQDPAEETRPADTPAALQTPTATPQPQQQQAANLPSGSGLRAEFRDVTIVVPGLDVKQSGNKSLQNANGAVYTLNSGKLNGATLSVSGTVTKISQRYQSIVMMNSDIGEVPLDALSITSRWETVKGSGNNYTISGLDQRSLQFYDADNEDIRDAVQKMARRRRLSHRKLQDLVNDVRKVRSVNQKPLHGELRSVMWKIDGKDASGRLFSKQIRIDIPM